MNEIELRRGETTTLPFTITDAANGLLGKRVTWSVANLPLGPRLLRKESGLGASSAAVTLTSITAAQLDGFISILTADYATLPEPQYYATLWVDDGVGGDRCATEDGADLLVIAKTVARPA